MTTPANKTDMKPDNSPGSLHVVATPIGNLGDISARAIKVLGSVDLIAAEDTRHSRILLDHLGLSVPMLSLHEHNEARRIEELLARLLQGDSLALISDAGTPLMSDPGFRLVQAVAAAGLQVIAVPGPSAILAALSVAGLATDRFQFEGFLPAKSEALKKRLQALALLPHTLVCFENPRRLKKTLAAICEIIGPTRECVVARELTKMHEQVLRGSAESLLATYESQDVLQKGEAVLLISGAPEVKSDWVELPLNQLLKLLSDSLPPRQAAAVAAELSGRRKNDLYSRIQSLQTDSSTERVE